MIAMCVQIESFRDGGGDVKFKVGTCKIAFPFVTGTLIESTLNCSKALMLLPMVWRCSFSDTKKSKPALTAKLRSKGKNNPPRVS